MHLHFSIHAVESERSTRETHIVRCHSILFGMHTKEHFALEHSSGSSHSSALTFRQLHFHSLILWRLKSVFITNKTQENHRHICQSLQTPQLPGCVTRTRATHSHSPTLPRSINRLASICISFKLLSSLGI